MSGLPDLPDLPDLRGLQVLVLGLGVSGVAAADALQMAGVTDLTVVDTRADTAVREQATALRGRGIDARTAAQDPAVVAGAGLVVTSPGIAPSNPLLHEALTRGRRIWSEPELAWRLNRGRTRLVAVTGTNGKTTTTQLLGACLRAPVGGNIGPPLSGLLASGEPPPLAVVELSSFQLRFTERLRADVGVLLNVAPDHLDWHGSIEDYQRAKARVWAGQRSSGAAGLHGGDWAVVGVDDPGARRTLALHPPPGRVAAATTGPPSPGQVGVEAGAIVSRLDGDTEVAPVAALGSRERAARGGAHQAAATHNLANALAAVTAALCAGAEPGSLQEALEAFRPGPHRLEQVATVAGVAYVNDSKATNPHAAAAALASVGAAGRPSVVWLAGGLDKGLDFRSLAEPVTQRVRAVVTVGSAGPALAAMARGLGVVTVEAGTVAAAVPLAAELAEPGDTVLLAPACASMDQFPDYAARGQAFRDAVAGLATADARQGADGG